MCSPGTAKCDFLYCSHQPSATVHPPLPAAPTVPALLGTPQVQVSQGTGVVNWPLPPAKASAASMAKKQGGKAGNLKPAPNSPKFTFLDLCVSTSVWGGCISYFIKSLDGHHRRRLSNTDNFPILTYLKGCTLLTDPPGCWLFASSLACFQGVQQQRGEHHVNGALWSSLSQSSLHHNAWNCSPFQSDISSTHWDGGNEEREGGGGKVTIQKIRSFDCCA